LRAWLVPASLNKHLFFIEGGTLAVENALKVAFDWKSRKNEAHGRRPGARDEGHAPREAFHGRSGYTLSLTNTDPKKTRTSRSSTGRASTTRRSVPATRKRSPTRKPRAEALDQAKRRLRTSARTTSPAFIMEPIQGEGGDNHFRPEFLQAMQELCRENDALFIFDEVQTGVGITGKDVGVPALRHQPDMSLRQEDAGVRLRLRTTGSMELAENVFTVGSRINSTWGGNLTDMVRSQRYFEIIDEENLVDNAARVGAYFLGELDRFQQEFPSLVSNVRGRGLMAAFDLPSGDVRETR
jgi:L-lysine 6-transaminase